ncbi:MAG TPA: hypothetical protein VEQ63_15045 [Bryobacteraceae bacterium]|nr:hypothetical protein [Bryobacteraceae bacterium]
MMLQGVLKIPKLVNSPNTQYSITYNGTRSKKRIQLGVYTAYSP